MVDLPKHVAVIPDGNRRWAKMKNLPAFEGHRRGFDAIYKIERKAREMGIKIFTVWAFSTENWKRTKNEVSYLMRMYESMIDKYLKEALKDQVRLIHIGRKDRIPERLRKKIDAAQEKTSAFDKYFSVFALDYGGRDEIVRAAKEITNSQFPIPNLDEDNFMKFLDTKDLPYPEPDMVIRTSGEKRSSGFMTYQAAYSEYVFADKYLPDFTISDFEKCVMDFSNRKRRFGE